MDDPMLLIDDDASHINALEEALFAGGDGPVKFERIKV
jgi:hypothetical protein